MDELAVIQRQDLQGFGIQLQGVKYVSFASNSVCLSEAIVGVSVELDSFVNLLETLGIV
jgi:hypothetical protein